MQNSLQAAALKLTREKNVTRLVRRAIQQQGNAPVVPTEKDQTETDALITVITSPANPDTRPKFLPTAVAAYLHLHAEPCRFTTKLSGNASKPSVR